MGTEASPGPGATVSCADLAGKVRPLFPAGVRSPGVCSGRGVPATPVAGASSLWSPAEGVHFQSHILIFLKEGKRGQKEALVLRYIIKWRFSFLKEQKEAKDSLIETSRLLLQQWPEQVGQGRLSPLAGGGLSQQVPGPWCALTAPHGRRWPVWPGNLPFASC